MSIGSALDATPVPRGCSCRLPAGVQTQIQYAAGVGCVVSILMHLPGQVAMEHSHGKVLQSARGAGPLAVGLGRTYTTGAVVRRPMTLHCACRAGGVQEDTTIHRGVMVPCTTIPTRVLHAPGALLACT